ncbi:uncharacterized protein LOC135143278 [Zophobas morio]|uniref:uncharacterized protein LOC135127514 n=1 Tax=Zophobas morio TaxID=2755281 RepID=UPI0030837927
MDENTENLPGTPPEVAEAAGAVNLLPEKSQKLYKIAYNQFMKWKQEKKITSFSERVILAYFADLSSKYKISTLWTYYSMLRSTLNINHNINIEQYHKLRAFLKRQGENYQPKKAKTLSPQQITKFITEAPDVKYLATKVALIMGIMGACRTQELHSMRIQDIKDLNSAFLVTLPNTKTKIRRSFTVTEDYYLICKKYLDLRPAEVQSDVFFLNYQNGKCTMQRIGINKFGGMPKEVAAYLGLPNPELFTGHSFRRSSATLLVDGGGDITDLKRHGGWKSSSVAEGYIDNSVKYKLETSKKIFKQVNPSSTPCTSIRAPVMAENCENIEEYAAVNCDNVVMNPSPPCTSSETNCGLRETSNFVKNSHSLSSNVSVDMKGKPIQISNCSGHFTFNFLAKTSNNNN